jgi:hypothetical protein
MALLENAQTFTGAKTVSGTTFDVVRESTSGYASTLRINTYGSAGNFSTSLQLRSARGTASSPTATQANDVLGGVGARGYGTTGFGTGDRASIRFFAGTSNWTDADQAAGMSFYTNPSGTSEQLAGTVNPNSSWYIGPTAGLVTNEIYGSLSVKETSATSVTNIQLVTGATEASTGSPFVHSTNRTQVYGITQTNGEGGHLILGPRATNDRSILFVNGNPTRIQVGEVNEVGQWLLGPNTGSNVTHVIQSGTETALTINSVGATADAYINLNSNAARVWSFGYDQGTTSFVFNQGSGTFGGNNVGYISAAGTWVLGASGSSQSHLVRGLLTQYYTANGRTAIDDSVAGVEATMGSFNATNKYGPAFKISANDTDFAEGTRWLAGIIGSAEATFSDISSPMGMEFLTTPAGAGSGSNPISVGRISSGGVWTLGTTSNTAAHFYYGALAGYSNSSVATNQVLYLHSDVGGTDVLKWRVDNDGDTISATGSYTSDARVKKDITSIHYGLNEILQLQPMSFRWSYENNSDVKSFSIDTAQNIQAIMPEMVREDGLEFEDENGTKFQTKAVYEKEIVAVLVKAIQEQQAIIDALTARIEALENP